MSSDSVSIPVSLLVWLLSLVFGGMMSLFSICAHLLINIRRTLTEFTTRCEVKDTQVTMRLDSLERHERRNRTQMKMDEEFMKGDGKWASHTATKD